jgi:hypothetical protein
MTVEHVLASGQPLDVPLKQTLRSIGAPTAHEQNALAFLSRGQLRRTLEALRFPPAAVAAAEIDSTQAVRVGERLREIPTTDELLAPLKAVLRNLGGVAVVILAVFSVLTTYVLPELEKIAKSVFTELPWATRLVLDVQHQLGGRGIFAIAILLIISVRIGARYLGESKLLWQLDAARACAAAAPLVAAGHRTEEVLQALVPITPRPEELASRLAGTTLDAPGLALLAKALVFEAERRAENLALTVHIIGTTILFSMAFVLFASTVTVLPHWLMWFAR